MKADIAVAGMGYVGLSLAVLLSQNNRVTAFDILEEKIGMLTTQNLAVERLGIGEWLIGTEVARGLVNREPSETTTVFPQPIGMTSQALSHQRVMTELRVPLRMASSIETGIPSIIW